SPDGKSIVTASWDRTVRVWDAATGQPLTPPLQHRNRVSAAFWSVAGKRLSTVTDDNSLQVREVANGAPLTPPMKIPAGGSHDGDVGGDPEEGDELPLDSRPMEDLVQLAQMLAVARIDAGGTVVPLQMDELAAAWTNLHEKYPKQFQADPEEIFLWHHSQ